MKKKVLLLAVSCREGGLCPGGVDLDNPKNWIRIVADDGKGGSVQGCDIDFADPLDIIEFNGRPMPCGRQQENWVIDNDSCVNKGKIKGKTDREVLDAVYRNYSYHGFWGNYKAYLNEDEFESGSEPSESIMKVSNVRIYKYGSKAKIDFDWSGAKYRIKGISMTDPDFYDQIDGKDIEFENAYIVISIPKECDWFNPNVEEYQAYKFVSRVYEI